MVTGTTSLGFSAATGASIAAESFLMPGCSEFTAPAACAGHVPNRKSRPLWRLSRHERSLRPGFLPRNLLSPLRAPRSFYVRLFNEKVFFLNRRFFRGGILDRGGLLDRRLLGERIFGSLRNGRLSGGRESGGEPNAQYDAIPTSKKTTAINFMKSPI